QSRSLELIANRPIVEECIEDTFQEKLSHLGGKENVLLVGEAGYDKDKNGPYHGILQELSFALFHLPERGLPQKNDHENWNLEGMKAGSSSSRAPSRMLQYPVVLVVFRATFILDSANTNLIREVLKDVRVRIKGSGSALVGIVYSQEELGTEAKSVSQMKFGLLIERIFQGYLWGICSYTRARPETILQVKRTIKETLQGKIAGKWTAAEELMPKLIAQGPSGTKWCWICQNKERRDPQEPNSAGYARIKSTGSLRNQMVLDMP
uniref:Uncharacterized protein n=1 Tax=Xenopus tropicalis TaxID=8364 RepID=A0A6I8RR48_XENTR